MTPHVATEVMDGTAPYHELTFDRIYQEYRPRIQRYLTRLVGPDDAEDVTQLVFARVSAALSEFRGAASLGTWIFRIARNAAADWRRTASRTAALHEALAVDMANAANAEVHAASPAPDDALIRRDMQRCLGRVVQELPDPHRDVLPLRALDGLSNAAIADTLGLSLATVKVRLHRARGQLRDTMAARCVVSRDRHGDLTCERKGAS